MFKKPDNLFITYTHPSDQKRKVNKRIVSSFVSRSYRPTSRKIVFERSHYRPFLSPAARPSAVDVNLIDLPIPNDILVSQSERVDLYASSMGKNAESKPNSPDASCWHSITGLSADPESLASEAQWLVDQLTSRFAPALNTNRSRYEAFLAFAAQNAECYNALLAQAYYRIDVGGFGDPHWLALYHRGEAMKLLREKMERSDDVAFNANEAIFIASLLLSVEYAHTDHEAWLLHKRAVECMVADQGGQDKLCHRLRDEMLRNEFFLQVLVHGRVDVCDWGAGATLRIHDCQPIEDTLLLGLPTVFQSLAHRLAFSAAAARIVLTFLPYLAQDGHCEQLPSQPSTHVRFGIDIAPSELDKVLRLVDTKKWKCKYVEHRACLALLVFIFNLHNQGSLPDKYLETLDDAAIDMITIKNSGPLPPRKCLLWSIATIGAAAATESPWRLDIPFMGHVIHKMARGDEHTAELRKMLHCYYLYGASPQST